MALLPTGPGQRAMSKADLGRCAKWRHGLPVLWLGYCRRSPTSVRVQADGFDRKDWRPGEGDPTIIRQKKRESQNDSRVSSVDAEGPRYGGMDRFNHAKQR